jgi:hypothetical protein
MPTSTPENIAHFHRVILHALDRLYAAFPLPLEIKVMELAELAMGTSDNAASKLEATFESLHFLKDEGLLKYSDHYSEDSTLFQVQLSMKALSVLGHVLDASGTAELHDHQQTLIARIRNVLAIRDQGANAAKLNRISPVDQVAMQLFTLAIAATPVAPTPKTNKYD